MELEDSWDDKDVDLEYDDGGGRGDIGIEIPERFTTISLNLDQIKEEIEDITARAQQSLPPDMSTDAVKIALDLHDWSFSDLISKTYNHPKSEMDYFTEIHVPFGNPPPIAPESILDPSCSGSGTAVEGDTADVQLFCEICSMESEDKDIHRHRCGSAVCLTCWKEYIQSEIVNNNRASLLCPCCPVYLEPRLIEELCDDGGIRLRLRAMLVETFIQKSAHHRRCPVPNCDLVFRLLDPSYAGWKPALCGCGSTSCLECSELWHGPMDCGTNSRWSSLVGNNDAQTKSWLLLNSKPCPKCGTPIEKTGGCNYMQCSNRNCRHRFCWICLQKAHDHSFGETCSKFQAKPTAAASTLEKAKLTHGRYLYYCERYQNMINSVRLDARHSPAIAIMTKKSELMNCGGDGTGTHELSYLDDIPWVMKRSKLTLAHSYALLYLTEDNPERDVFENALQFLQSKVDGLSYFMEHELKGISNPSQIATFVKDNLNFCKSRIQIIDSISEDNYKAGSWIFLPVEEDAKK